MAAPRMFCDICDIFDLHETEDCPRQAMDSPPPPQHSRRVGKKQTEERPYCEICEGDKVKSIFIVVRKAHFANIFLIIFIAYFPNTMGRVAQSV